MRAYTCLLCPPPSCSTHTHTVRDLAAQHGLSAGEITEDWVAYSTQHMSCDLTEASCDKWAAQLSVRSKTAGTVAKRQAVTKRRPDVLTKDDIHEL